MNKKTFSRFVQIIIFISILGVFITNFNFLSHNNETRYDVVDNKIKFVKMNSINVSLFDIYQIESVGQSAYGLTSADFNNDGLVDFAVSYATKPFTCSRIAIFYNKNNFEFLKDIVYEFNYSYIMDLDSGDYDNDHDIDLIYTYNEYKWYENIPYNMNGTIVMLYNNGNNKFFKKTTIAKSSTDKILDYDRRINPQLSSADYDNDGDIDLLIGDNSGKIELLINNGSGFFNTKGIINDFGAFSWGITSADFNRDKKIDFIVTTSDEIEEVIGYYYLKNNEGYPFYFEKNFGQIIESHHCVSVSLTCIDYNKDDYKDFISGNLNEIFLFINNQTIFKKVFISRLPDNLEGNGEILTYGGLTSADFNNDGMDDIIVGGVQGVIRLFINKGEYNS